MGTGFNGDGWGRILILQGRMVMGINVRPRAGSSVLDLHLCWYVCNSAIAPLHGKFLY